MIRRITIFFPFIFVAIAGFCQVINIDSVRRELLVPKHDTAKVYTLGWLAYQLGLRDKYDSSGYYANKALELSERINYEKGKGYAYIVLGNYYSQFLDYAKAIKYYADAKNIMEKAGDKQFAGIATINLGAVYTNLSEKMEGLDYLNTISPLPAIDFL